MGGVIQDPVLLGCFGMQDNTLDVLLSFKVLALSILEEWGRSGASLCGCSFARQVLSHCTTPGIHLLITKDGSSVDWRKEKAQ